VGAYKDDDNGTDSGSAYMFELWKQDDQKFLASDGAADDWFGYSVSVFGGTAIVGAYKDDDLGSQSGSAYVSRYNGSTWVEEAKLVASDGGIGDSFGKSVSISGDTALVGAYGDDDKGTDSGSAYVFRYNNSPCFRSVDVRARRTSDRRFFGFSVSISGDTALVGAIENDTINSGSAYVFRYDGGSWVEEQKLVASDGAASDYFGESVSISGDIALVGANGDDDEGLDSGSAYVYRYNGSTDEWEEEDKLVPGDGAANDFFGGSVSISGDTALVGAKWDDDNGSLSGSAYVFRYNGSTWVEESKLVPSDGASLDYFGRSVSISGDTVLVGAYRDEDNGAYSGSAYMFDLRNQ